MFIYSYKQKQELADRTVTLGCYICDGWGLTMRTVLAACKAGKIAVRGNGVKILNINIQKSCK